MHRWLAVLRSPAVLLAALLAASFLGAGCGSSGGGGGSPTLASIAVGPAPITVARGASAQLRATGTWSDGTTTDLTAQSTWNSSAPSVASVSGSGVLTGQEIGTASITASSSGVTGTGSATVTGAGLARIEVTPAPFSLPAGGARQLTATGTYADGSTANLTAQVAWTSSAEPVATVTAAGLAAASASALPGAAATVTAALSGKSGTSTLTVSAVTLTGVAVTPRTGDVTAGQGLQLSATATWSDGATADVTGRATWTSTTPATVAVDASGRASAPADARVDTKVLVSAALGAVAGGSTLRVVRGPPIGPSRGNDPLAGQEWYLVNTGQKAFADIAGEAGADLGLSNAFDLGLSGARVKVAVVDTGLEIAHEDLAKNVEETGSWNFTTDPPGPNPTNTWDAKGDHGTSVAGITAMEYDNGKGGMGVAPRAMLNGYAIIDSAWTDNDWIKTLGSSAASPKSDDVWIFNQSYGYSVVAPASIDERVERQYLAGVTGLRSGRGAIYVKSATNNYLDYEYGKPKVWADCAEAIAAKVTCMNANADPVNVLPYNIVVGATNAAGVQASYSTAGSSIWISAPGGEYGENEALSTRTFKYFYQPAMVTTDQSTCAKGYSRTGVGTSYFNNGDANNVSCNYTNGMNGTSSAAPATSGAIALLLDARPDLGWRDVKHILASTASKIDPSRGPVSVALGNGDYVAELGWTRNQAAYDFHDVYGFGAVKVDAALEMARTWVVGTLGAFVTRDWVSSGTIAVPIPDFDKNGGSSDLVVPAGQGLVIEAVQIQWSAKHAEMRDMGVQLTSPMGTTSILFNICSAFTSADPVDMILLSNAFYGERSEGTWRIKVVDGRSNGKSGLLTNWKIRVFGR
jgi:subtilisin-like proprotein convertase family protein/subtilisin family serine protease